MINAYPINTYIDLDIAQLCFLIKKKRKMFALEKNCVSYKKKYVSISDFKNPKHFMLTTLRDYVLD